MSVSVESDPADGLMGFGQLSQMAGWLALDANQHGHATRYFTSTVYVAHESGDAGLAASALAYMSLQETYRGNPQRALALAQTAAVGDGGTLSPLTRTMLSARLARAHAGAGNETECRQALDTMRASFSDRGDSEEPLWVSYVDDVEVAAQEGACYLELGEVAPAAESMRHAIGQLDAKTPYRVRDRVHYLSRLAKCHLLDGNLEEACEVATQALRLCEDIGSSRIFERIEEFHNSLELFGNAASAVEFRELFQAVSGGVRQS